MNIRTRIAAVGTVAVLAAVPTVMASGAVAKPAAKATVRAARSKKLKKTITVGRTGRTIYWLAPETPKHLLCTPRACLQEWPMVTVPNGTKPIAGPGVKGKLGTVKRGNKTQVTLRNMPLYYFSGDSAAGQVNGEGLRNFGGTWHAVTAKPAAASSHTDAAPTGGSGNSGDDW